MNLKKYILLLLIAFLCTEVKAQSNLVPNGSFEDTLGTPACNSIINFNKVRFWTRPAGSPDYMNSCANSYGTYPYRSTVPHNCNGYQNPKTGNAMMGIGTYYVTTDSVNYGSEYISVKLNDTLKANTWYYGEFYASLANICERAVNRLGAYISVNSFTTANYSFTNTIHTQIEFDTTQYFRDTLNWVKISNTFLAQGGETHLTIGSFKDGTHMKKTAINSAFVNQCNVAGTLAFAYFYIDDIHLEKLESAWAINDTTLNCGDSTRIGRNTSTVSDYTWSPSFGLSNAHVAQPMASPTVNTTYTLTKQTGTNITTDAVVITVTNTNCDVGLREQLRNARIKVYPNPAADELKIELVLNDDQKGSIEIYSLLGSLVKIQTLNNGITTLDTRELNSGTYFYSIKTNGKASKQDKLIIIK